MSNTSSRRPLTQYLDALYPLARVLDGDAQADDLVAETYRRASDADDFPETPGAIRARLFEILLQVRDDARAAREDKRRRDVLTHVDLPGEETHEDDPSGSEAGTLDATAGSGENRTPEAVPEADEGDGDDAPDDAAPSVSSFRRDVAQQSAERALPVAFAACSARERLTLTLDVLGDLDDAQMARVLDVSPDDVPARRDDAHASLRAALRDTLTGPERMLVDVALPEDALRESLRALLTSRFRPAPASLRSTVSGLLIEVDSDDDETASRRRPATSASSGVGKTVRNVLAGLFLIAVLGGGIYGLTVLLTPTPEPEPSLVEFTSQQTEAVGDVADVTASAGEAYVDSVWGRRLTTPQFEDATLTGVGRLAIGDVEVPVLLYDDAQTGGRIAAFAYSYALIDRLQDQAQLDTALRDRLSDAGATVAQQIGNRTVLAWRDRDDVFLAVSTTDTPNTFRERLVR